MLIVSLLELVGLIDRIHSTLSAVARSVQSGIFCPSGRQGSTSSQTNIVSWSVSSDVKGIDQLIRLGKTLD